MHRFGSSSKKKGKQAAPVHPPAVDAATSATVATSASVTSIRKDVLKNASMALEVLKSVGEASEIIAPLKVVAGVLKSVIDVALLIQKNGGDMKDLVEKLVHQQDLLQDEVEKLSNPKFGKSDIKALKKPLETYIQNLGKLQEELEGMANRYKPGAKNTLRKVWKARSDQEELSSYTQKLQDAFQQFMNSTVSFIATQTLFLEAQMREISERMAEKDIRDALSQLVYADAHGNQHDVCLEGTRTVILETITLWANDTTQPPVFALVDQAGTGKSTVAAHMARQWENDSALLGRFFFAKPSTVTGKYVASTVAKDIAKNAPSLRPLIVKAIEEHSDLSACSIREQLNWIVLTPLRSLKTPGIIVVDALDECLEADRAIILDTLLAFVSTPDRPPLQILLTCRPERNIISRLRDPKYANYIHQIDFSPDLNTEQAGQDDIVHYANVHLRSVLSSSDEINQFVKRANRLFIWASTARRILEDAYDPSSLLKELLMKDSTLNSLYADILVSVSGKQEDILMKVLQAICVAREPLRLDELDEILGLKGGITGRVVASLRSVLSDGSRGQAVQVLHPTFIEFLLGTDAGRFGISSKDAEALMANRCIKTCITDLKYDICDIHYQSEYPPLNKDVLDLEKRLEEKTWHLRYAAIYGLSHVSLSLDNKPVLEGLRRFFNNKLLNWIELMSLYGKIYSLIQSVQQLKTQIEESLELSTTFMASSDVNWCSQITGMVQAFQGVIEESAMQIYFSALAFEPPTSYISRMYLPIFVKSIPRIICGRRNLQSQSIALCGHTNAVTCIVYSPDDHTIASGSDDYTVRLWDASTGAAVAELTGHTGRVNCLTFSPDSKILVSGSNDGTVLLWDPSTGAAVARLTEHTRMVSRIAFSPDGKTLVSGSYDGTVRLWDPSTCAVVAELTGHTGRVNCLTFSPDGKTLALGSSDYTLQLWDASTGAAVAKLTGHTGEVSCLAFSPDGKMLASGSDDSAVRLWDPSTGLAVAGLTGHTHEVYCLIFSPNGKMLVSGSIDCTVRLWDPSTGAAVAELTGHTGRINCLAFSPDGKILISGSDDSAVRLWDPSTGAAVAKFTEHIGEVNCLAFSSKGKMLVSGSSDCTVQLWDPSSGAAVAELTGHTGGIKCLAFSPDGKMLASGSSDRTLRLWGPSTGAAVAELTGHTREVYCLAFSPNSKILASGSDDRTVRLWDSSTGAAVAELTGHTSFARSLAFSPDGKTLASGSHDQTVRLWDLDTRQTVKKLLQGSPVGSLEYQLQNDKLFLMVGGLFGEGTLWNLSTNPPFCCSSEGAPRSSPPSISSLILYNKYSEYTHILTECISFHLPPSFAFGAFCSQEGIAAYGGDDGSIIIVDCSHLV